VFEMKSEIISIETKYKGWTRFSVVSVCLPNGQLIQREIEDHGSAVAVLAFDPERCLFFRCVLSVFRQRDDKW
jgi:hypothetical protein